ncbi:MAG: TIGR04283 family arsenosugar biosynthesis glycosyltransferase [Loktanella sp.]|nr:TIGR04283 family arsenosugar biosynthesis glycosyltransferase [Loktanella sp.]
MNAINNAASQDANSAGTAALAKVSIILPVRNEAATIRKVLQLLATYDAAVEVIVVDGDSQDGTADLAAGLADRIIQSAPGRARQMNAGFAVASGEIILFLHADTMLPPTALADIRQIARPGAPVWGRFDVDIAGRSLLLPVVAALMNLRSRLSGVATGDQAIFVRRDILSRIGGLPDIAIMEDVALSKALRRISAPLCLRSRVRTSGRRWDANGALRTIVTMWLMRLLYVSGVAPDRLAGLYARLRSG